MNRQSSTIEITPIPGEGYRLSREDGLTFTLLWFPDDRPVLYAGSWTRRTRPQRGIVQLGADVGDKLAAARQWVLSYPAKPAAAVRASAPP